MTAEGTPTPPHALVTGAASGIGRHVVGRLVGLGYRVTATDLDERGLSTARDEERWAAAHTRLDALDVTQSAAWSRVWGAAEEAFGPVDGLVHAAAVLRPGYLLDATDEDIELQFDVNLKGTAFALREGGRRMRSRGQGSLVVLASLAGFAPVAGLTVYSSSKFGVRGLALAARTELRSSGVRVTVVYPDAVDTPMLSLQEDYDEAALTFSGARPLSVDEVGRAVERALKDGPAEVALPFGRATMARLATVWPTLADRLDPILRKKGQAALSKLRKREK